MKLILIFNILALTLFVAQPPLAHGDDTLAPGCKTQLSEYDKNLRREFGTTFKSLLLEKMSAGEVFKDDVLSGSLFKIENNKFQGQMYALKGSKNLYLFCRTEPLIGKPKLLFAALEPAPKTQWERFALTPKYFRGPISVVSSWVKFKGGPKVPGSIDMGTFGILKYVPTNNSWPDFYELHPNDGGTAEVQVLSPEQVVQKLIGADEDESE